MYITNTHTIMSEFIENNNEEKDQTQEDDAVISFHKNCMFVKITVDSEDETLLAKYREAVDKHNRESEEIHYNSGFDLFMPESLRIEPDWFLKTKMIDHKVKCEAFLCQGSEDEGWELVPTGFYLYPRSSLSKEPLMLANHVGIIDSGYRGNLIAAVRNLGADEIKEIPQYTRLFQICAPTLCPIHVVLVEKYELSNTARGEGGFGSSGK